MNKKAILGHKCLMKIKYMIILTLQLCIIILLFDFYTTFYYVL